MRKPIWILIFLVTCFGCAQSTESPEQRVSSVDKGWNNAAISDESFAVLAVDVQRLLRGSRDDSFEAKERLLAHFSNERGISLNQLDEAQVIMGGNQMGADDTTHTKIVYLESPEIDAVTAGKMTKYQLEEKEIQGVPCFVGKKRGAWGAVVVNEKVLAFAVERKMPEVIGALERSGDLTKELRDVKSRSDLILVFKGGDSARRLATEFTWPKPLQDLVHQAESGIVRVNFRDDLVFDAQIQFASEGKSTMHAEAVNDMLPPVVHMIEASFSEQAVQGAKRTIRVVSRAVSGDRSEDRRRSEKDGQDIQFICAVLEESKSRISRKDFESSIQTTWW